MLIWAHPHNEDNYFPPPCRGLVPDQDTLSSQQSTPSVEEDPQGETEPEIRLTFRVPPMNPAYGYVFGSDPSVCDTLLGSMKHGISRLMFDININEAGRIVMNTPANSKVKIKLIPRRRSKELIIRGYYIRALISSCLCLSP